MAFATNTLVNGAWTTTTMDVNAVLRHYQQQDKLAATNTVAVQKPPVLGLLSQTVVRSPLAHWILPVRLRTGYSSDVAFIGDNFVQIKELRPDGLLWDVVQKNNFGARIRNARAVGSSTEDPQSHGDILSTQIKDEVDDTGAQMGAGGDGKTTSWRKDPLASQTLLLQLDSGDSLFLRLRQIGRRRWEFVSSRQRVSKPMLTVQPGMHLAVDPSSRYVAVGCSEGVFAIYAMNSREELMRQHVQGQPLRYIASERYIYFQGVIHKMDFLHPSADDDKHIILLVLVVFKGRTRMQLYEWEAGCDLRQIRAHSRRGHLLDESRQMPILLIPITKQSMFLLICEDSIVLCRGILQGSPTFSLYGGEDAPTKIHHGSGPPLWTAWTRPFRLPHHTVDQDDVYLVREDGLLKYLELKQGQDEIVEMGVGILDYNCGTAFAFMDYNPLDGNTGDILVTGGDAYAGATYVILARETPTLRETIPNWCPAQDLVTTSKFQDREFDEPKKKSYHGKEHLPKPDRIFACVGKGSQGAIAEFRYGLEARLGLETEFHTPVIDSWVLPATNCLVKGQNEDGSLFLLSLVHGSAVLNLSNDASEINELDPRTTYLDMSSRTIAASVYGGSVVQVTEQSIRFADPYTKHAFRESDLLTIHLDNAGSNDSPVGCGTIIDDAVIFESIALFTTHFEYNTYLQVLDLRRATAIEHGVLPVINLPARTALTLRSFSSHVTSLAMYSVKRTLYGIVAEWTGESVALTFQPIFSGEGEPRTISIPQNYGENHVRLERLISMAVCSGPPGFMVIACGTRNGLVVTLHISEEDFSITSFWSARVGATSVTVKRDENTGHKNLVFVTCDSKLYCLNVPAAQETRPSLDATSDRRAVNQVFLTDATKPCLQQPGVTAVAALLTSTVDETNADILLVSGTQLFLANLGTQSKPVPRNLPIGGTPTRLLYSHYLNVLIVAASVKGKCTLLFIDPETGRDLARPADKKGAPLDYVTGLGEENERVFRLLEWSYMKDGKTWYFIVACTNTGRLLIMSTERETEAAAQPLDSSMETDLGDGEERPLGIRYWTRYKFRCAKPIYSVAGFAEGLLYCSGNTIYCDILNLLDKRFETVARYDLPSSAVDLVYEDNKIYATTNAHSLEVLQLVRTIEGTTKIIQTHGDQVTRSALHHRILGKSPENLLNLVSDKSCNMVGLWATHDAKADTLEPVFEAQLSHSILRFRSGRYRPIWDPTWDEPQGVIANSDTIPSSKSYPEVLGLSIDGSLYNFTILDLPSWKFLRFLLNLALQSPKICEFTYTQGTLPLVPETQPKSMMHIDGDILQRIEVGDLETLLRIGEESQDATRTQACFRELLREMHVGALDEDADMSVYTKRAYKDLDFFLRPVL